MIKVNWDVEELVALIDIYRKSSSDKNCIIDDELQALANRLIKRADRLGISHDEKFRNHSGMRMMFQNVVYIATDGKQGLPAASARMRKVYSMLLTNPDVFDMILEDFNQRYK